MKEERIWTVYVHTNKINLKRYVGITSKNVNYRWKNGQGYATQPFGKAIEKYGWGNFEHEIVASNLTEDEANNFEVMLIKELDTLINNGNGYNISEGGKSGSIDRSMYTGKNATNITSTIYLNNMEIFECSKYACDKYNLDSSALSKTLKGEQKTCGKNRETGERLMFVRYDANKPFLFYQKLKEEKMSITHKSKGNHHNSKKVICLNTKEVFKSCSDATEKYNAHGIHRCCKKTSKYSGKHPVTKERLQWMYYEEYQKELGEVI